MKPLFLLTLLSLISCKNENQPWTSDLNSPSAFIQEIEPGVTLNPSMYFMNILETDDELAPVTNQYPNIEEMIIPTSALTIREGSKNITHLNALPCNKFFSLEQSFSLKTNDNTEGVTNTFKAWLYNDREMYSYTSSLDQGGMLTFGMYLICHQGETEYKLKISRLIEDGNLIVVRDPSYDFSSVDLHKLFFIY